MKLARSVVALACAFAYAAFATGSSAGENWRIVESAGAVKIGGAAFMPVAVTKDMVLPADSWVETAATGRVVLIRGAESIAVGPNSRVLLPDEEVNGNTQVLQTLGSALYQIGKQKAPHFQVDTPYLAAVVKGTTFTVSVDDQATSVEVSEGLVEVATPDRADVEFVHPGYTGSVSREQHDSVLVTATERPAGSPPARAKTPKDKTASLGQPRVVIASTIGESQIDVKAVSGGLAQGAVAPAAAIVRTIQEAGEVPSTKNLAAGDGVGSSVSGVTAVAVDVVSTEPVSLAETSGPKTLSVTMEPIAIAVSDVGAIEAPSTDVGDSVSVVDVGVGGIDAGVGVDVGGDGGNGGNGGGLGLGIGVGAAGGGVGVGIGVGNGGVGLGVGVGLGGGNGGGQGLGLGIGLGK